MAKILSKLPEASSRGTAKYPWHQWLNGQAWCLSRGEDFETPAIDFGCCARAAGTRRNLKVTARVFGDEVYLQAFPR